MNRSFAFIAALLLTALSVSSACFAADSLSPVHFTLEPRNGNGAEIQARFHTGTTDGGDHNWSDDFAAQELAGLDVSALRSAGQHPLRFAIVREAGRLDCAGSGGSSHASGDCAFTPNNGFSNALASRGIVRPSSRQSFSMMALNVHLALADAIRTARYPSPTIDQLIAMTALNVSPGYIGDLAAAGYRPSKIDTLIEFKALDISPEWIGGFARIGYATMPSDQLVQLKALDITPAYVTGFERLGYGRLPVSSLVQFKALGVTPAYVESLQRAGLARLSPDKIVQMKALGITPGEAAALPR